METHRHDPKCKEIFSLLSEYLNLELPADACRDIEAHIANCPPCIEFTESLRKTLALCKRYQGSAMPEPLSTEAREQLLDAYRNMLEARAQGGSI